MISCNQIASESIFSVDIVSINLDVLLMYYLLRIMNEHEHKTKKYSSLSWRLTMDTETIVYKASIMQTHGKTLYDIQKCKSCIHENKY